MRVRARWNQKDNQRGLRDIASVVAANAWKAAGELVLNLENEGFETSTHAQRLDVIAEVTAFLLHCVDRMIYGKFEEEDRAEFVTAIAVKLTGIMQDNRVDAVGPGDYRQGFVNMLNQRMDEYADCSYSESDGPGFNMRRTVGEYVRKRMGEKDNKWVTDYVMDLEAPKALDYVERAMKSLFPSQFGVDEKALRSGQKRNWDE